MAGIVVLAAAYVLSQFYRSFLAVLTPMLAQDLGATNTDLSLASGMWFISFALMQFAVGISLDRYGPRRTSAVLLGICGGGGAILFAVASTPWMLIAAMALIGMGCAPILMSAMFIFAKTFRPSLFAMAASWVMAVGMGGNVVGASPMAMAAEWAGWRGVMGALALLTMFSAFAILLVVKDPPQSDGAARSGFSGYLEVARIRSLWPILPFLLLNGAIAAGIRGLWAGPFLVDVHGADPIAIGNVTLFMALAMVAANLIYGPLDAIFGTRKWVVAAGGAMGVGACIFLALRPDASVATITIVFVIAGFAGGYFGVLMAQGRSFLPPHLIGRGVTAMNFLGIGGVGLMQFLSGQVLDAAAARGEPAEAYGMLFAFYALVVGSALVIYLFSRDVKPERLAANPSVTP